MKEEVKDPSELTQQRKNMSEDERREFERHFLLQKGRSLVRMAPDFPKEGINFIDLLPIFVNPIVAGNFASSIAGEAEGIVILPESRGYLLASAFSVFQLPVVFARKPGKRPIPEQFLIKVEGDSEYGKSSFEIDIRDLMQSTAFVNKNENGKYPITIFDDILATGGTVKAIQDALPEQFEPAKNLFLAEIMDLNGRGILKGETKSILQY